MGDGMFDRLHFNADALRERDRFLAFCEEFVRCLERRISG
jgi:hypothetical protein